jgi:hypothetical protein
MTNKTSPLIRFHSYNPYEVRYPGLKVVSRESLQLIKAFRSNGYAVAVEPDDGSKLNYIARKGLQDLLSDPVVLFVVSIPVSIITGVISAWLYDLRKQTDKANDVRMSVEIDEQGRRVRYDQHGDPISDERFLSLLAELSERSKRYAESQYTRAPDPVHPVPIHLEHSEEIVGWAEKLSKDDIGLKVEGVRIIDEDTWNRIEAGELKGLSIAGIVTRSTCTICDSEYVECNHITGKSYGNEICGNRIDAFRIAEISLVAQPVNPLAQIQLYR